ncbi:MAG: protein-L-isoaspartate(D-aspartate) O-methyltransferase [Bacteroidia bacterium]|jgi:protein-L-isoaspartate(D-aspartate) O-methyltransferase|nr:protein-L-isoaspartate(D-aspartate) O-methyltransferase [Bacteroidia bacterium]MCC6767532.1 protein-L-isoaspartate(D-aspartate) O-methyltransferase [Bacteroidia bacterium]
MRELEDNYRHKGLRNRLIEDIRSKGLMDEKTLEAMRAVPRHLFFSDQAFLEKAYEDIAFQIGEGQTISHPSTVAYQTQLLGLEKNHKVLEIGTGSGYQTAVLLQITAKVYSVERQRVLFQRTKKFMEQLNLNAKLFFGDGYLGLPAFAPFDRIIVTAGAPHIPEALLLQLKPGGRMVIPVGVNGKQVMHVIDKSADGKLNAEVHGEFSFVPLLEDRT